MVANALLVLLRVVAVAPNSSSLRPVSESTWALLATSVLGTFGVMTLLFVVSWLFVLGVQTNVSPIYAIYPSL